MTVYVAVEKAIGTRYGARVKAVRLTNREYGRRYARFAADHKMMPAPSSGAIHPGYLTVRNLGLPSQYETWIPDSAFEDMYAVEKESAPE